MSNTTLPKETKAKIKEAFSDKYDVKFGSFGSYKTPGACIKKKGAARVVIKPGWSGYQITVTFWKKTKNGGYKECWPKGYSSELRYDNSKLSEEKALRLKLEIVAKFLKSARKLEIAKDPEVLLPTTILNNGLYEELSRRSGKFEKNATVFIDVPLTDERLIKCVREIRNKLPVGYEIRPSMLRKNVTRILTRRAKAKKTYRLGSVEFKKHVIVGFPWVEVKGDRDIGDPDAYVWVTAGARIKKHDRYNLVTYRLDIDMENGRFLYYGKLIEFENQEEALGLIRKAIADR